MQSVAQTPQVRRAFAVLAAAAALLLLAVPLASASPLKMLLAAGLLLAPIALYLALWKPLIFPFAAYIVMMPFDYVTPIGKFGTVTKLLGIASAVLLLLWCMRKHAPVRISPARAAVVATILLMLSSTFWSVDQTATVLALPTYAGLMLLYLAVSNVPCPLPSFKLLLTAAAVSGAAAAAYGAVLYYQHAPRIVTVHADELRLLIQSGSTTQDPNVFADSLLFAAAILLMSAIRPGRILVRCASAAAFLITCLTMLLSGSREAAVAVLAVAAYYFARSKYRVAIATAIACAGLATMTVPNLLLSRFADLHSPRSEIWKVGFEAFKRYWFAGSGFGTFSSVYDDFYLRVHQFYSYGWDSPPHNVLLHFAVELGVFGAAILCFFVAAQFFELRAIGKNDPLYDYRLILEASLLAVFCTAMFIDSFNQKWTWLVFSMIALLRNYAAQRKTQAASERGDPLAKAERNGFPSVEPLHKGPAAIADSV